MNVSPLSEYDNLLYTNIKFGIYPALLFPTLLTFDSNRCPLHFCWSIQIHTFSLGPRLASGFVNNAWLHIEHRQSCRCLWLFLSTKIHPVDIVAFAKLHQLLDVLDSVVPTKEETDSILVKY